MAHSAQRLLVEVELDVLCLLLDSLEDLVACVSLGSTRELVQPSMVYLDTLGDNL